MSDLSCLNAFWVLCIIAFGGHVLYRKWQTHYERYLDAEHYRKTALRDLYDANIQIRNLIQQNEGGAVGYVYVLKSDSGHYKIGKTINPNVRLETFGVKLPIEVSYVVLIKSPNHHQLEAALHRRFKHKRVNGEWFDLSQSDLISLEQFPGNILQ